MQDKRHGLPHSVKLVYNMPIHPDNTFVGKGKKGFDFLGLYLARWLGWALLAASNSSFSSPCQSVSAHEIFFNWQECICVTQSSKVLFRIELSSETFCFNSLPVSGLVTPESLPSASQTIPNCNSVSSYQLDPSSLYVFKNQSVTTKPYDFFACSTDETGVFSGGYHGLKLCDDEVSLRFDLNNCPPTIPSVSISISSNDLSEASSSTAIIVTATASTNVSDPQTVNLAVTGTGITTSDYTLSNKTITIPYGQSTGSVTFTVQDDSLYEGNETATLTISNPSDGITLGTTTTQNITITDDDSQPSVSLSLSDSPLAENAGTATVTATLSNPSFQNVTANLIFSGTATAGIDYNKSDSIVIPAGTTSNTMSITGINDSLDEDNETVIVDINSVTNGSIKNGTQTVTATITDDNGTPQEINVKGNNNSIADGDNSPITTDHTDFGSTYINSGTVERTFTIENTGGRILSITNPSITGTNASDFSVTDAPPTQVNAYESITFAITFNPSGTGLRTANVSIGNDDLDENPYDFAIQGTGLIYISPSQPTTQQPTETGCSLSSKNINCYLNNNGNTIKDINIEDSGIVDGGTLEGEIKNQGIIKNVTLAEGTKVDGGQIQGKISGNPKAPAILTNTKITANSELSFVILGENVELPDDVILIDVELRGASVNGGKLQGTIRTSSSATVIKNVSLGENTRIIGGTLAGTISGTPEKPAILEHLKVEPQTKLTHVTIGDGVEMPTDVSLASGVRFTKTENIPENVDLTATLPKKGDNADLSADPVMEGQGILLAINRLPEFESAELTVFQHGKGFLYLDIDGIRYAVNPIQVKHLSQSEHLLIESGQTVRFKTDTQIEVLAPPAVQDISSFKENLSKFNLQEVNISNDGNIKVPTNETTWYCGRADLASTIVDKDTVFGFITKEDGNLALIFKDEKGHKREQIIYPSPADMSALGKFDLTPKGILEFEIKGKKYKGRLDYQVKQGTTTSEGIKVTEIPDSNGDFMITYPGGAEQLLFGLAE